MHISVLKFLPCTIYHAIKSIKTLSVNNSTSNSVLGPCLDALELLLLVAEPKSKVWPNLTPAHRTLIPLVDVNTSKPSRSAADTNVARYQLMQC